MRQHLAGLAVLSASLFGCGRPSTPRPQPTASIPSPAAPTAEPRLHQSFAEAVSEDSPGNQQPPPDRTRAGLPTGKLRLDVQKLWDTIRFTNTAGKPLSCIATVTTDLGTFRVRLRPDVAPNHVRNFIALAKAGYYNGLVFEHLIRQESDDGPASAVELVEAGCPLGTGEPGVGHLGYWLRPEFGDALKHEAGTFGAFHDESPESAACRFYVTLTNAPAMDGNFTAFGHVVEGLDVVRTISGQPKVEGSVQPVKPVTIQSVTVETRDAP